MDQELLKRSLNRLEAFGHRVITEELGGESYPADAGAIARVLDHVNALEAEVSKYKGVLGLKICQYLARIETLEELLREAGDRLGGYMGEYHHEVSVLRERITEALPPTVEDAS